MSTSRDNLWTELFKLNGHFNNYTTEHKSVPAMRWCLIQNTLVLQLYILHVHAPCLCEQNWIFSLLNVQLPAWTLILLNKHYLVSNKRPGKAYVHNCIELIYTLVSLLQVTNLSYWTWNLFWIKITVTRLRRKPFLRTDKPFCKIHSLVCQSQICSEREYVCTQLLNSLPESTVRNIKLPPSFQQ